MNFTSPAYLPDSEERIGRLRKIIAGRPVAILAAGPSIKELEKRICDLKNTDICYFILNDFIYETHILQQIDKHASVILNSCREDIYQKIEKIIDFLKRDEDNMFVSSFWWDTFGRLGPDFDLNQFISKYDRKLIFFSLSPSVSYRLLPNNNNPLHFNRGNSLQVLIQLAVIGKASRIILFGSDGYCKENCEEYYYRPQEYEVMPRENLIWDTNLFNAIAPISIKNVYKTYNLEPIDILNCSEKSFLTSFPKVSYDEAFDCLLTAKKFDRISDLRVPKISIISLYLNNAGFLRQILNKISNQSYTNYEHIIIYNEDDEKIQDFKQQFPNFKWIQEKGMGWIPAVKKGISEARGDYIFQYGIDNGYLNEDWICTCVEIFENDPEISLVWGISENINKERNFEEAAKPHFFERPPVYAKNFIYFWLKQKIVFPQGNTCVRKNVFRECLSSMNSKIGDEREAWIAFNFRFNTLGYQPSFIPLVADYHRIPDIIERKNTDPETQNLIKKYCEEINQYKKQLIDGKKVHHYRQGSGKLLPDGFKTSIFLFFNIGELLNEMLPNKLLIDFEKILNYWIIYRWKILKIGIAICWQQLIKKPYTMIRSLV